LSQKQAATPASPRPGDDFIARQGPAFLAHLLRRLSDELVQGAAAWYPTMGVTAPPRTISTLLALDDLGPLGITELARLLRQTHPLVITWIREQTSLSFVSTGSDPKDRRRSVVRLTARGKAEVVRARKALSAMEQASLHLLASGGDGEGLFNALWRMEGACRDTPFADLLQRIAASANPH
jgi:DNA-binding MarR family transcriptional regulator